MIGRIHADKFFQSRYLLNEVNVKIKLVRSRSTFCLIGANEFRVKIESAIMFVTKVKLAPSVFLAHAKALDNSTAKYAIHCHMSVPAIFDNVLKDTCLVKLIDKDTDMVEHPSAIYIVREGYYHTVDSLAHELKIMLILLGISLEMEMGRVVLQNDSNYNVHFN